MVVLTDEHATEALQDTTQHTDTLMNRLSQRIHKPLSELVHAMFGSQQLYPTCFTAMQASQPSINQTRPPGQESVSSSPILLLLLCHQFMSQHWHILLLLHSRLKQWRLSLPQRFPNHSTNLEITCPLVNQIVVNTLLQDDYVLHLGD